MVQKFVGYDYEYLVFKEKLTKKEYYFSIMALCRKTGRYSHVNNVNVVLSALGVGDDPRYEDSEWSGTQKKVDRWFKRAQEFLTDLKYLEYVERQLDEDRECGEWEHRIIFRKPQKRRKKPVKIKVEIRYPPPAISS